MRGLETVQSNHPWVAVTAKRPPEKRLGGGDVAGTAEVGFDRFALFIHGAVQVNPVAAHLEVGLIAAPGITDRTFMGLPAFLEL